jgi:biopolymer transport protein TolQ
MHPILLTASLPMRPSDPSILETFLHAGLMAKLVLAILGLFSLLSWAVVIAKTLHLRRADAHTSRFLDHFHRAKRFSEVSAVAGKLHASPLVGIFQSGYAEIDAQLKVQSAVQSAAQGISQDLPQSVPPDDVKLRSVPSLERALQRAIHQETAELSRWTPFLATTAAATPFIGLFGTVWGIMVAFRDIGLTGSTSLVVVAPGIAEALVNTAAGLAAAIPALIAYNYFASRVRRTRVGMEDFALELLNLSERHFT